MDGVGRVVGSGMEIELEGKKWLLDPITLRDFGVIENKILASRPNPLELVKEQIAGLPDALAEKLLFKAYEDAKKRNVVTPKEIQGWLKTLNGMIFVIWMKMQSKYGAEWTVERIEKAINMMSDDEIAKVQAAQEVASGTDLLGNSTGPSHSNETTPAQ